MRGGERIVDVEIGVLRHRGGEFGIVGFLARPEANIVEQADIAIAQDADRLRDDGTADLGDEHHLLAQHILDIVLHQAGRQRRMTHAARPPEMGEQQHFRALFRQFEDRGRNRLHPREI